MSYACVVLLCHIRVSHSNVTKQAFLVHIIAQFVEKQYEVHFLAHTITTSAFSATERYNMSLMKRRSLVLLVLKVVRGHEQVRSGVVILNVTQRRTNASTSWSKSSETCSMSKVIITVALCERRRIE